MSELAVDRFDCAFERRCMCEHDFRKRILFWWVDYGYYAKCRLCHCIRLGARVVKPFIVTIRGAP